MVKAVLRATLINAVALYLVSRAVAGLHLPSELRPLLLVLFAFTFIHLFLKPILKLIFGPLNFLTFGLVSLTLDVAILYGLTFLVPAFSFSTWNFPGASIAGITIAPYPLSTIHSIIVGAVSINFVRTFLNYLSS